MAIYVPNIRKHVSTVRICATLFLARTFGRYVHSVSGWDFEYAVYDWRGRTWAIPTSPIEQEAA